MSSIKIAEAIGIVREVTGWNPRSLGASIFVSKAISDEERSELQDELDNPEIEVLDDFDKTKIDL